MVLRQSMLFSVGGGRAYDAPCFFPCLSFLSFSSLLSFFGNRICWQGLEVIDHMPVDWDSIELLGGRLVLWQPMHQCERGEGKGTDSFPEGQQPNRGLGIGRSHLFRIMRSTGHGDGLGPGGCARAPVFQIHSVRRSYKHEGKRDWLGVGSGYTLRSRVCPSSLANDASLPTMMSCPSELFGNTLLQPGYR